MTSSGGRAAFRRQVTVVVSTVIWGAILFGAAGRLDWIAGWTYLGVYTLGLAVTGVVVSRRNPGVIAARGERREGTKPFDKAFGALYLPSLLALALVAGLDAGRFGWSPLPPWTLPVGVLLHLLAMVPITWAMAENPFLETTVRIQTDRGHRAITSGPYRLVRHPMYVGGVAMFLAAPLILGSAWAYVPAGLLVVLMVIRTALEDATLRRELPGYADYARRTRYRLVPGLW